MRHFAGVHFSFFNDVNEAAFIDNRKDHRWRERNGQLFYVTYVWPWRFGGHSSQEYETFFLGPIYFLWVRG